MPRGGSAWPWAWLAAAGVLEVVWVIALKRSDGFSRFAWSGVTVAAVACSFVFMSQALRVLPMGTVYAVWTGIGAAGGMLWGIGLEGEPAGALRIGCVCLILLGVAGLKLGS